MPAPADAASAWSLETLVQGLRRIDPRAARLVRWRVLEGRGLQACAASLGTSPDAVEVLFWRAAAELFAMLTGERPTFISDPAREAAAAHALSLWVDGSAPASSSPQLSAAVTALTGLRARPAAALEVLAAAELAEQDSPSSRRENLLRKVALLVLAAAAVYLYLSGHPPFATSPTREVPRPTRSSP